MKSTKDSLFLIIGLAMIGGSFYLFLQKPAPAHYQPVQTVSEETKSSGPTIHIADKAIPVEIADTDEERTQGLSGRATLPSGHGLLFIFETPGSYGFWMKEMNFPIDIIWIDESWQVSNIERGVLPETFPNIFYPNRAIKYVLELPAGDAAFFGIDSGSTLFLDDRK